MARIQDITPERLQFLEGSGEDTPSSGVVRIYAKEGKLYSKDDAGIETLLAHGGELDAVMTTQGDLIIQGATDPARLAIGTPNQILRVNSAATAPEWVGNTRGISYYIDGNLTTLLKGSFIAPCALNVSHLKAIVGTAPAGSALILDIHKNGVTVFTNQENRPTIAIGETAVTSVAPDVTGIAAGDLVTLCIDQVGAAGADLSVTLFCEVAV